MTRPIDAVIQFLEAERDRGVTHIHLDAEARKVLNHLRKLDVKPAPKPPAPAPAAMPSAPTADVPAPSTPRDGGLPVVRRIAATSPAGETKAARIAALREQARQWQAAQALGTLRATMVFSVGDPDAKLMLIGEAPGYEEEKKAEPFVGPAGQKLDDILKAMGLSRSSVYISNILKFRPAVARQATNNRPPGPEEIAACLPLILAEIDVVQPSCIVALGGTAAAGLLGIQQSVGHLRGMWHRFNEIPVRVTYHPSYLLRNDGNMKVKREVWDDMLSVMELLDMPISDRQRGFFLPKPQA